MQIIRQNVEPPTWEFHDASQEERAELGAFLKRCGHGTIVNHWEPFLVSFTDPKVIAAFEAEFRPSLMASRV